MNKLTTQYPQKIQSIPIIILCLFFFLPLGFFLEFLPLPDTPLLLLPLSLLVGVAADPSIFCRSRSVLGRSYSVPDRLPTRDVRPLVNTRWICAITSTIRTYMKARFKYSGQQNNILLEILFVFTIRIQQILQNMLYKKCEQPFVLKEQLLCFKSKVLIGQCHTFCYHQN